MRSALFCISLFCFYSCGQSIWFEKDYYERISGIKFPANYEILETFDNGEFLTATVFRIDSIELLNFIKTNHFDSLQNLRDAQLLSERYFTNNIPHFTSTKNLFIAWKTEDKVDYKYIVDLNTNKLWAEIRYPDWGGT